MINESLEQLTLSEKRKRILIRTIPKKNKVYQLIKNDELSDEEIYQLSIAFSITGALDRKIIANSVLVAIAMKTRIREIRQTTREMIRRHKTRMNYTLNQRLFFEDILIFGWGTNKEKSYIRREIISILKEEELSTEKMDFFLKNGVDIKTLIHKLQRKNADYEAVFKPYKNNEKYSELVRNKLDGIELKAISRIKVVSQEITRIRKGYQRPYLGI